MEKRSLYRKPNPLVFHSLQLLCRGLCKYYFRMEITRNELRGSSGRRVLIANHEAAMDFLTTYAVVPSNTHAVTSRAMMHALPVYPLMKACGIIEKNQFQTSVMDLKRMRAVLDNDGVLLFYPAGLMTESGMSTPIPQATGKSLKWFDADVYVAKVRGTYLSQPKWSRKLRRGRLSLDVYRLATRQELAAMSADEAAALVTEHLSFDAYRYNDAQKIAYENGDHIEGLENVLYQCPACGREYTIEATEKNTLTCSACGYTVKSDVYGMLTAQNGHETIFRYPSDWHAHIEETVRQHIRQRPDYRLETLATILQINEKRHRFEPVGEGLVALEPDCFQIDGTLHGEPFSRRVPTADFPMLPFKPGKCFEIQQGSEIFRIQPQDGRIVMKWILTLKAAYQLRHGLIPGCL